MMRFRILSLALLIGSALNAQEIDRTKGDPKISEYWEPVPPIVTPGKTAHDAPSDAIILFDGKNLSEWVATKDKTSPPTWTLEDGAMTVKPGTGGITTKKGFGDCQLHIEFRTPKVLTGTSQQRGNSGIFLMDRYELQVLDNYDNATYVNGQVGSIYKQLPPQVNPARPPGEWQTYDVIFTAPRFHNDGRLISQARITVLLNGVLVQNNMSLWGGSEYIGSPVYKKHSDKEPISLQDHGNLISYRNIWIREL